MYAATPDLSHFGNVNMNSGENNAYKKPYL